MSAPVAGALGACIGSLPVFAIGATRARRSKRWTQQAEALARKSDIALPEALRPRVIDHLRRRYLLGLAMLPPVLVASSVVMGETADRRSWLPGMVILSCFLPLLQTFVTLGVSRWPRLRTAAPARVTHLDRPSPLTAFTERERWALASGVVLTFATGLWSLSNQGAGVGWWTLFLVGNLSALGLAFVVGQSVMNRPSSASNQLELGWDDVFRYKDVRALLIGTSWMATAVVLFLSWNGYYDDAHPNGFSFLPFYAVIGGAILIGRVFRGGATRWRTAWQPTQS